VVTIAAAGYDPLYLISIGAPPDLRFPGAAATVELPRPEDVIVTALRRPRHPALVARVVTAGLSVAAALGIVAVMARDSQRTTQAGSADRTVEVRIGEDVGDAEARESLRAWLKGQPDLDRDGSLTVVDAPPDTTSAPS
jgi:hypothetical protein